MLLTDVVELMRKYKDQIELLPIEQISPYKRSLRKHSREQIAGVKASILKYGMMRSLIADRNGVIIVGHALYLAAKELGLAMLPVMRPAHLSDDEIRAFRIADNALSDMSVFNDPELAIELKELEEINFPLEYTFVPSAKMDVLIDSAGDTADADDEASEPEKDAVSRVGDLWEMGEHRLLCADATLETSYATLMGSEKAQMGFSDAPYNVPVDKFVSGTGRHKEFVQASGEMSKPEFTSFLGKACANIAACTIPAGIVYLCMDWRHLPELTEAAAPVFGPPKQICVWVKDNAGMGTFYRSQHEMVMVFKNGDGKHINNFGLGETGRYRTNVWPYAGANTFRKGRMEDLADHPTVKPTALVADAIRDCSKRGGIILDPFMGSGTTILAAERTGRRAYGMELDPIYVDVAIRRWQTRTGKQAVLASTGQTFAEVMAERLNLIENKEVAHEPA